MITANVEADEVTAAAKGAHDEVVSVAGIFADAIRRIYTDESVSTLFVD